MNLSTVQLQALKAHIAANTNAITVGGNSVQIKDAAHSPDVAPDVAAWYNQTAAGPWVVWRTNVPVSEYKGANGLVWTEVDALSVGKARIWEWLTGNLTLSVNAADPNVRAGIANAFSGTTVTNLTAMAKRNATNAEKLFSSGTGTVNTTANLGTINGGYAEGNLTGTDIVNAWNS